MATTKHGAYGTLTSALTTGLNTLGNNTNSAASSAIDNTSALDLYIDLELVLGTQTARSAGAQVIVYLTPAVDGTPTFTDVNETVAEVCAVFLLDAATTARRAAVRDVPIPPGQFKLFLRNATGQAFNATGNTLKYRPHSLQTV